MKLTTQRSALFRKKIYSFYRSHKRIFPWRGRDIDPYYILVSELMLQQTQTDRVVPKYNAFIQRFPTVKVLASSSLSEVFSFWQGLGYNRRALYVKRLAEMVVKKYAGVLPNNEKELQTLPGIGPYTAAAVCAFAFNQPTVFIETNIRAVYIYEFLKNQHQIEDRNLLPLIEQTLDTTQPKIWYWALMDYGAVLKKKHGNINTKSKHYHKQTKFEGSNRQARAAILKLLLKKPMTHVGIQQNISRDPQLIAIILSQLITEKMIKKTGRLYQLES